MNNNNPGINHPIIDHAVKEMANMFGIKPDPEFKFTFLHDREKSVVGFRCKNIRLAKLALRKAYRGDLQIFKCEELL